MTPTCIVQCSLGLFYDFKAIRECLWFDKRCKTPFIGNRIEYLMQSNLKVNFLNSVFIAQEGNQMARKNVSASLNNVRAIEFQINFRFHSSRDDASSYL